MMRSWLHFCITWLSTSDGWYVLPCKYVHYHGVQVCDSGQCALYHQFPLLVYEKFFALHAFPFLYQYLQSLLLNVLVVLFCCTTWLALPCSQIRIRNDDATSGKKEIKFRFSCSISNFTRIRQPVQYHIYTKSLPNPPPRR